MFSEIKVKLKFNIKLKEIVSVILKHLQKVTQNANLKNNEAILRVFSKILSIEQDILECMISKCLSNDEKKHVHRVKFKD